MPSNLAPLLWFAAIIALIPVALWLLKRMPMGAMAAQGGLRSVATLALSPNQRVVTVEVGSGDERRWLVLGVSPQSVTLLRDMAAQGEAPTPGPSLAPGFAQLLSRTRRDAARDMARDAGA